MIGPETHSFLMIYVDDILIFSPTIEKHFEHLDYVLQTLQKTNMSIKFAKCKFFQTEIKFLGHVVSGSEIKVDHDKDSAILQFPVPSCHFANF